MIRGLWTQKETTFEGKHYRVHGAVNEPKGVQKPHIPLDCIAGGGEKMTLGLARPARRRLRHHGIHPRWPPTSSPCYEKHCQDVDRDNNTINRTVTTTSP